MLELDDFRKGSTLTAETVQIAQQLHLLTMEPFQTSHDGVSLPIGIPSSHHCLPQTPHCLLRLLAPPKSVVLVVSEDDVIHDLPSYFLLRLHVLESMGVTELKASGETVGCGLFIPPCEHPSLLEEEDLTEEELTGGVDEGVLGLLQLRPHLLQQVAVKFALDLQQQSSYLQLSPAVVLLHAVADGRQEECLRVSTFGLSATDESLEKVDADGGELVIGEEFGGVGEDGFGLSAELRWVDGGGLVGCGVCGEER